MSRRLKNMPASLLRQSRFVKLGSERIPALLAHPDWDRPAPVVLWMHGRTAYKELDPGRYLRWMRRGVAACAIDLPGHGERRDERLQSAASTLRVVEQAVEEIDLVVEALADPGFESVFDTDRMGVGGMSAGGMAALRRCCEPHAFRCVAVESTMGDLKKADFAGRASDSLIERLDPMRHLDGWRPIPALALHSEADAWAPVESIRSFFDELRRRSPHLDPDAVRLATWPETGAPNEHAGFGRVANEAKNIQTEFLARHLLGGAGGQEQGDG